MVRVSHQLPLRVVPVEFPVPSRSICALMLKHRMTLRRPKPLRC